MLRYYVSHLGGAWGLSRHSGRRAARFRLAAGGTCAVELLELRRRGACDRRTVLRHKRGVDACAALSRAPPHGCRVPSRRGCGGFGGQLVGRAPNSGSAPSVPTLDVRGALLAREWTTRWSERRWRRRGRLGGVGVGATPSAPRRVTCHFLSLATSRSI
eukprot:scaffold26257_cov100-Isochrysis_galbana.AAC.6